MVNYGKNRQKRAPSIAALRFPPFSAVAIPELGQENEI